MNAHLRALTPVAPIRAETLMRPASRLMRPEALAALQPSRISAARSLMARAARGRWVITCQQFDVDMRGRGRAHYTIDAEGWRFSFPVFSFEPSSKERTGRIIGRAWDMMAALVEGDMSAGEREALAAELPRLYEGRASSRTLTWARSNRSGRLFNLAVEALARGEQPPLAEIGRTCYLMRNTGIDGNGTFGSRNFLAFGADHPLRSSLRAQLLTAYMMRVFASDLVLHLARLQGGSATARPHPDLWRYLGVGNGSALGLMYFMNNHPQLIDRWITIREMAIAQARCLAIGPDAAPLDVLARLLDKAIVFRLQDLAEYEAFTPSAVIADELVMIRAELTRLVERVRAGAAEAQPLVGFVRSLDGRVHPEAFETLLSLLIELVPNEADALTETLVLDEELTCRPEMPVRRLRQIITDEYPWVFRIDLSSEAASRYVWYKSRTAEEPRRGPREEIEGAHNLGLDIPRMVLALDRDLAAVPPDQSVARFLAAHPQHRLMATRVQALAGLPYHSLQANIMDEAFVPAHITRFLNVGLHGIDKARDFLSRNLRGVLFHGAPTPEDLASGAADPHWFYPPVPQT